MAPTHAIIFKGNGKTAVEKVEVPVPPPGYVLVRVEAWAINPVDWKIVDYTISPPGTQLGCELAGKVEAVGSSLVKPFKVGDLVAGFAEPGISNFPTGGAFAGLVLLHSAIAFAVPSGIAPEIAVAFPVGFITAGAVIFGKLEVPHSGAAGQPLVIYGGSTAMGIIGIQLAKAAGCHVIAVAGVRHHENLKKLGADDCVDYKDADAGVAAVRAKLAAGGAGSRFDRVAVDFVSDKSTLTFAARCIAKGDHAGTTLDHTHGGKVVTVLKVTPDPVADIDATLESTMVDVFGIYIGEKDANGVFMSDAAREAARNLDFGVKLLADGKMTIKTVANRGGSGLEGVLHGMEESRAGKVSGEKLVYTP